MTGAATCGRSCRKENNFVMLGVVVGAFFLECSAQSHQLCSVESLSNGLVRFEQFIIHDTKLIPPNTSWVFSMNIRLGCRCWSMARWSPWFSLLWVIVVDSFFITSDYTMQKILSFMPGKQHFTCEKSAFNVSRLQFIWNPNSFAFESFPMISNDMKLFVESLLM